MDRKMLIGLLRKGMKYSPGKHRLWISRCFEITVRPNRMVELDEYEGFTAEENLVSDGYPRMEDKGDCKGMFHVGKSIIHLENGQVVEKTGSGWGKKPRTRSSIKKA